MLGEKENVFKKVYPLHIHFMIIGCFVFYRMSIPIRKKIDLYNDNHEDNTFIIPENRINEVVELIHSSIKK